MICFNGIDYYIPNLKIAEKVYKLYREIGAFRNNNPRQIKAIVEQSRINIANYLKISPSRLYFTPNVTIANNMAIEFIDSNLKCIITSEYEPLSILKPLEYKSKKFGIPIKFVSYNADSSIDWQNFKNLLRSNDNAFVALSQAHPKTGRFMPIKRISEICQKTNSLFLCDISYTFGRLNLNLEDCPIDFVTASSETIGALQGAGFIYISNQNKPKPLYLGDSSEFGIVPGNENVLAIYSFSQAMEYFFKRNSDFEEHFSNLKRNLFNNLVQCEIEYKSVNASDEHFLPNFVNLFLPEIKDLQTAIINLELNDIYVADGSLSNQNKNILITFSTQNNENEIDIFCSVLSDILEKQK